MKNFLVIFLSIVVVILALQLARQQPAAPTYASEPAPESVVEVVTAVEPLPAGAPSQPTAVSTPKKQTPAPEITALGRSLLDASVAGNFEAFKRVVASHGDAHMRRVMSEPSTAETFRRASAVIGPPCRDGYALDSLGSLVQTGHKVHLWRLRPKAGEDEFLVRLTMRGDRLAGFFFQ